VSSDHAAVDCRSPNDRLVALPSMLNCPTQQSPLLQASCSLTHRLAGHSPQIFVRVTLHTLAYSLRMLPEPPYTQHRRRHIPDGEVYVPQCKTDRSLPHCDGQNMHARQG
jgi:hypothetical protein